MIYASGMSSRGNILKYQTQIAVYYFNMIDVDIHGKVIRLSVCPRVRIRGALSSLHILYFTSLEIIARATEFSALRDGLT
jgi:hypothetical protein